MPTDALYRLLPALVLLAAAVGCNSARQQSYDITVYNKAERPMTLWLLKDGRPFEESWRSPEDYAWFQDGEHGGIIVNPGEVASASRTGKFDKQARAILIVYHGAQSFDGMLATSRGSPLRDDLVIQPGKTRVTITQRGVEQEHLGSLEPR